MRAGRPRSRGGRPDGEVEGIRRATSLKVDLHPLGSSRNATGVPVGRLILFDKPWLKCKRFS